MRIGAMRRVEGLITGTPALEPFGTGVFPVSSRLVSLLSSERRANDLIREQWLSINNPALSELAPAAHRAVYQLTKPHRRADALRRRGAVRCAAMAVVVAAAKLFENSSSVSTAAFHSRLHRKLDDRK